MKRFITFLSILALTCAPLSAFARVGLVSSQGIWLSKDKVFAGDTVKIYTIVNNDMYEKLSASVEFYSNTKLIGTTQFSEVPKELAKQLWVEYAFPKGIAHVTVNLTNIVAINADGTQAPIPANAAVTKQVSADFDIDSDSDHDGIGDKEDTDDDNDGVSDEDELKNGTNPLNPDTDGDGLSDKKEGELGTNPTKSDTDGDGVGDAEEVRLGTDPKKKDTDGDGVNDGGEIAHGTNPLVADTDKDGLSDGKEAKAGTNPTKTDTDGDGIKDGQEVKAGTNPLKTDTDADGLTDAQEVKMGTNPLQKDTDSDGVSDSVEKKNGTNPLAAPIVETANDVDSGTAGQEETLAPDTQQDGQVKGEKDFALGDSAASIVKWPFILGSIFSFFLFLIFYGVYLQKKSGEERE